MILLVLVIIFTLIHYYVQFKNKVPLHSKIIPSFFLNHSLGAVLAFVEIDMQPLDDLIEECAKKNIKITYSSIIGKALGNMYHDSTCFGKICFGNYIKSDSVDFSLAVDVDGKDLYNFTIKDSSNKSIFKISEDLRLKVKKIKLKQDSEQKNHNKLNKLFPIWFI